MTKVSGPSLTGLHVLVTRPAAQSNALSAAIRAMGNQPIALPMLAISVFPEDRIEKDKIINLNHYDIIIVISANAAQAGLELVDRYWPQLPEGITWLAVGSATAQLLTQYGIDVKVPQQGANTEGLLQMVELSEVSGQKILVMKGQGGRQLLANNLVTRGARVDTLNLYKRNKPAYTDKELQDELIAQSPDVVLATSINIIDNLEDIVEPRLPTLKSLPLIVASSRVAEHARLSGYKQVITAGNASDEAMLDALKSLS